MALEDQAVQDSLHQFQLAMTVKSLLDGSRRELW
jgi:hypothetical protein